MAVRATMTVSKLPPKKSGVIVTIKSDTDWTTCNVYKERTSCRACKPLLMSISIPDPMIPTAII